MSDTIALPLTPAQLATVLAAVMLYRQAGGYPALQADLRGIAGGAGKALGAASLDALVSQIMRATVSEDDTPALPSDVAAAPCPRPALTLETITDADIERAVRLFGRPAA